MVSSRAWRVHACKDSNKVTVDHATVASMYPTITNIKTVKFWNFLPDSDCLLVVGSKKMQAAARYKNNRPKADTAVPRLGETATKQRSRSLRFKPESVLLLFMDMSEVII